MFFIYCCYYDATKKDELGGVSFMGGISSVPNVVGRKPLKSKRPLGSPICSWSVIFKLILRDRSEYDAVVDFCEYR